MTPTETETEALTGVGAVGVWLYGAARASGANSFGSMFRVTTFGESHGGGVGCVIDGVPPRMKLTQEEIQVRAIQK